MSDLPVGHGVKTVTGRARRIVAAIRDTSVIIPVKDDPRVVECVASIDEDVEVVICLNGSDDATRTLVREGLSRRVTLLEITEANLGAAYDAAVRGSSGRYLLFMDSDCVFAPGTIRALVERVIDHPVVKGRVRFTSDGSVLSRWIGRSRSFQIADHVNAYSPPLIYDRSIEDEIGGYHYSSLIHWEEDREFDFRLQLAGIPVHERPDAIVSHAAQNGISDLRSGFRYGIGEGIGQELGLFITPWLPWRLANDLGSVLRIARIGGLGPALYRIAWLSSYHAGTLYHVLRDPYGVRPCYPDGVGRLRVTRGVPGHTTKLASGHADLLRAEHLRQGRRIIPRRS
jgi:glycosyltransferase involved in cell wall biosynthesis